MYDKSVAGEHRYYAITIQVAATTVYDLLDANAKAEINSIMTTGLPVQADTTYPSRNNNNRDRAPVDGYVLSTIGDFNAGSSATSTVEIISKNTQYVCPYYFWLTKTWLSASVPTSAIVRVFFS